MEKDIEAAEIPWSDKLILVCSKCGEKIIKNSDQEVQNPSERIKDDLKNWIISAGLKKKIRAATSSCLNICPKDRITLVSVSSGKNTELKAITVDPTISIEKIKKELL